MDDDIARVAALRELRHWNERVFFVISIAANFVLSILLVRTKDEAIRPYSRILLLTCVADVLFSLSCMVVEVETLFAKGVYIIIVNGIPAQWSQQWQIAAAAFWFFPLHVSIFIPPIHFLFRYFLVVKGRLLSHKELAAMFIAVVAFSASQAIGVYTGFNSVSDHRRLYAHLIEPVWMPHGERFAPYLGYEAHDFRGTIQIGVTILGMVGITILAIYTNARILLTLRKHNMSPKTRQMQTQLNRLMFADGLSVALVDVIPNIVSMSSLTLKLNDTGYGIFTNMLVVWIPAVNPLVIMCLVSSYRRQLVPKCLQRNTNVIVVYPTTDAGLSLAIGAPPEANVTGEESP